MMVLNWSKVNKSLRSGRRRISSVNSGIIKNKRRRISSVSNDNIVIKLEKSDKPDKKFKVHGGVLGNKTIHFGAKGMSDYTIHKDEQRMHRYENRHKSRENWTKSGIKSAGFWSKNILWNKPNFMASIKDTEKRFGIKIQFKA